jgi:hypothetical protein
MELNTIERFLMTMIVIGIVLIMLSPVFAYYSACRSAQVYNVQNNTSFTCGDFFWASAQINSQTQTIKLK